MTEGVLRRDELASLDEMFLTGTTSEVLAVVQVDGQAIGEGKPGTVTGQLYTTYWREVKAAVPG